MNCPACQGGLKPGDEVMQDDLCDDHLLAALFPQPRDAS